MKRIEDGGIGRREVLCGLTAGIMLPSASIASSAAASQMSATNIAWPDANQWGSLRRLLGDRFLDVILPEIDTDEATELLRNPFYLRDQVALTQSSGLLDGWRSEPSVYAVRARDAMDVSAAIRFAGQHQVRLVVKGGGHSYHGQSSAPNSLLVWTRDLEDIEVHENFVPRGSQGSGLPAVSVGAGCVWHDVYHAVTTRGGRYVQGGGCTTVGVAGLVQCGGFGSFSKTFGTAAAGLLEAEIVTADGRVLTVNAYRHGDLFWALKGGGGGTWGVVTRMTLRTHELPATFGALNWQVGAMSDAAYHRLLERFVAFYAEKLCNPHWGEQVSARTDNRLQIAMVFQGIDQETAANSWRDLIDYVEARPNDYRVLVPMQIVELPANKLWDGAYLRENLPDVISWDERREIPIPRFWWAGSTGEVGAFWHGYKSVWLPGSLLSVGQRGHLVDAWFKASRYWTTTFHFNKGLAGAPAKAIEASRNTPINPQMLDAFALAIIAKDGPSAYRSSPNLALAREDSQNIDKAMIELRRAAPGAGSYLPQSDYNLDDWPTAYWGSNADRLAAIKAKYDPDNLFIAHHSIGSLS